MSLKKLLLWILWIYTIYFIWLWNFSVQAQEKNLMLGDVFIHYFENLDENIPQSYHYIEVYFSNIDKWSQLHTALQKAIYLDVFPNLHNLFPLDYQVSSKILVYFNTHIFGCEGEIPEKNRLTQKDILDAIQAGKKCFQASQQKITKQVIQIGQTDKYEITKEKTFKILEDVFIRLQNKHYYAQDFEKEKLIEGAIQGMTAATGDKYTTYFPPQESEAFFEEMSGNYEWIGAYINMNTPGVLLIEAPILKGPADVAGLKPGDQIIEINEYMVTPETSVREAITHIKWPTGTTVQLKILRGTEEKIVFVKRAAIDIEFAQSQKINSNTFYIQLSMFWEGITEDFEKYMREIKNLWNNVEKLIIDLRDNPGGDLEEVLAMLSMFVPKGEPILYVKYKDMDEERISDGREKYNLEGLSVVILVNENSASASEIFAGTLKDYFPNISLIWKKTFWKGSVQQILSYGNGSSLKYTVANWFTGKTKTLIQDIWITPDYTVEFDEKKFQADWTDTQLDFAKKL